MTNTASGSRLPRWPLRCLFLLLLVSATGAGVSVAPAAAHAQGVPAQPSWQTVSTRYFTIYYPEGEQKTAEWYATFADDVNASVSALLGASPLSGLTLRIYASEADYGQANPLAETHPGILAHAFPEEKEIGVAVERLRQVQPEIARESFRHEITHIVAGALSGQHLPVGFQEGLAQYNELSQSRGEEVKKLIETAQSTSVRLLSWGELNSRRRFARYIDIAYPQSYTVMAFLAERYGMGLFSRFLTELSTNTRYDSALEAVYGKPMDSLETEWRDYLPYFISDGWKQNLLNAESLDPSIAFFNGGSFSEARQGFAATEKLYVDLGRLSKAAEAGRYRLKAEQAMEAEAELALARENLDEHNYAEASKGAQLAATRFSSLGLSAWTAQAEGVGTLARKGVDSVAALEQARSNGGLGALFDTEPRARAAGETLASLGDDARVEDANRVLAETWLAQRAFALAALVAGMLAVIVGLAAAVLLGWRGRRKLRPDVPGAQAQEEVPVWL